MATVERKGRWTNRMATKENGKSPPLHRLAEVREQQGVSVRSAARQLGVDARKVREQEGETTDLRLSDLYAWQKILSVPLVELLMDSEAPLSRPVMERARLVRIMKTVKTIIECAASPATQRLAETLSAQLLEVMPELAEVSPWHSVGQRRSLDELGRAAELLVSEESLMQYDWE